jgi:thiamine biosynthesis lipoprotein ApbE
MSIRVRWGLIGLVLAVFHVVVAFPATCRAERFTFHHEHVLGTSLEIQIEADNEAAAEQAEARVLTEIERLSRVFSTYDAASEFSRWQREVGPTTRLSPELMDVLAASDRYRELSRGAFNPAVQSFTDLWKAAANRGSRPMPEELARIAAMVRKTQWTLDPQKGTARRTAEGPLTLNAIAKGAIVDAACQAATAGELGNDGIHGVVVCIGGDLRVSGDIVHPVHIVDPFHNEENATPAATVYVHNRSLATSGNYRRGFKVGDTWYSHILDARTGEPAGKIVSATVVAETDMDADALATTFSILTPAETKALAETLGNIEYLLIAADGERFTSSGWNELTRPGLFRRAEAARATLAFADERAKEEAPKDEAKPAGDGLLELTVKYELSKPEGAQYRRPYVAVWLEDADEFPVRTSVLWMTTKQPGPRWHRDLLRWYRNDRVRKLADSKDLIGTISGATRGPGEYKAVFDGKDDSGKPLAPGKYTLFIEVAREHGTYQLIRQSLTLGADAIPETKLKPNVEVKAASFEYRKASAAAKPAAADADKPAGK